MNELDKVGDQTNGQNYDLVKQMTLLGRGECGKTSILTRFFKNEFHEVINATPVESQEYGFEMRGKRMKLKIWDTSGQEEFSRLRPLTIPISDYIMICYSVSDRRSFFEVENTLVPMIKQKAQDHAKIILVATKTDTWTENDTTYEEGFVLANNIGAIGFYESSSLTGEGINEIFAGLRNVMCENFNQTKPRLFSRIFNCCSSADRELL